MVPWSLLLTNFTPKRILNLIFLTILFPTDPITTTVYSTPDFNAAINSSLIVHLLFTVHLPFTVQRKPNGHSSSSAWKDCSGSQFTS